MTQWFQLNQLTVQALRIFTKDIGDYVFHIDACFHMERSEIICKNGKPKKNDTSNRLKGLHDVLSVIIGIDDSYFWSCSADKQAVDHVDKSGVTIVLKLRTMV